MKILSPGAVLFHADRQTDMTKLIVAFRNFANARESGPRLRGHEEIEIEIEMLYCTENLR